MARGNSAVSCANNASVRAPNFTKQTPRWPACSTLARPPRGPRARQGAERREGRRPGGARLAGGGKKGAVLGLGGGAATGGAPEAAGGLSAKKKAPTGGGAAGRPGSPRG